MNKILFPFSEYLNTLFKNSLNGHRVDDAANFEASFLELHNRGVVDAGSFRKDENRWVVWIRNVLL